MSGWIGVDLDGTLAEYGGWQGPLHIGKPIMPMVERVKGWIAEGREVRIFTARMYDDGSPGRDIEVRMARAAIELWCELHIGVKLPVTNVKDFGMIQLWDDRAVRVVENTGWPCCSVKR